MGRELSSSLTNIKHVKCITIIIIIDKYKTHLMYNKTFKLNKNIFRSIKIHQRRVKSYNYYTDSSIGFHTHYRLSLLISIMTIIYTLMVGVRRMIKHLIKNIRKIIMLTYFKTNNLYIFFLNVTFYTLINNMEILLLIKMHCLAFFDKVNCTQITDIVCHLSSRRTVNKSLTKPDVITPLGTVFNFQTEIVNGELSCAKLYPVTQ